MFLCPTALSPNSPNARTVKLEKTDLYLISGDLLPLGSASLAYRHTRNLNDKDTTCVVDVGTVVEGVADGDWLRVAGPTRQRYLPMVINQQRVIVRRELFYLDNSKLRAKTPGLQYCNTRSLEDQAEGMMPWGSYVMGFPLQDAWVRVGSRYLPREVNGLQVLDLQHGRADALLDRPAVHDNLGAFLVEASSPVAASGTSGVGSPAAQSPAATVRSPTSPEVVGIPAMSYATGCPEWALAFQGKWVNNIGQVVTIASALVCWPDGTATPIRPGPGVSLEMTYENENCAARLTSDKCLLWDDGDVWVRVDRSFGVGSPRVGIGSPRVRIGSPRRDR